MLIFEPILQHDGGRYDNFLHVMKTVEFHELSRTLLEKLNSRGQKVENRDFKIWIFRKIVIQKSEK